ncbi:MAG: ATPase [Actinomycetota bacterium]
MDIFARLDRLEDFIANSKKVPLSGAVRVNEAEFYDILDDIRATLPNELKQARLVTKERDRILGEATRKEQDVLAQAEHRAEGMIMDTEIIKQAQLEKEHILEEAEEEARRIKYDAEDYADQVFGELEASLTEVRDSTEDILRRVTGWREKLRGYEEQGTGEYEYEERTEE